MVNKGEHTHRIKLLLVDDEEGYVNVLSKRMAKREIEVTKALSGSEAIRAIRFKEFDVAVVDLKMEDMDGIEVMRILRKIDPSLEVIILTGHGSEHAAREAISIGAFDYLTKPCDLPDLLEKVKAAFRRRQAEMSSDQRSTTGH